MAHLKKIKMTTPTYGDRIDHIATCTTATGHESTRYQLKEVYYIE